MHITKRFTSDHKMISAYTNKRSTKKDLQNHKTHIHAPSEDNWLSKRGHTHYKAECGPGSVLAS